MPTLAKHAQQLRGANLARTGRLCTVILLVAGVAAGTLFHALNLASRLAQTSDSAQGLVAGDAVAHGNVLLSGWHLPLDDYYFTDTIPCAMFEWAAGPRPFLLILVPSLVYALFVLVALLTCIRRSRPTTSNLEAAATVTLLLAAPVWIGSWDPILLSDMHMATAAGAFVALALCAHIAGCGRRNAWLAGTALLVVAPAIIASDPFSLVFAFGPALALLTVDSALHPVTRNVRLALLLLGCGTALGLLLPLFIALAGGFTTENDVLTGFIGAPLFARNLFAVALDTVTLFGANPLIIDIGWRAVFLLVLRWSALAIVVVALFRVARHLFARQHGSLFDRLLCAGMLTVLAACGLSGQFAKGITPQTLWTGCPSMRFLVPVFLFGAVLADRQPSRMIAALRTLSARNVARGTLALFAMLTIFAGGWMSALDARPIWIDNNPPALAARWLAQRGLLQGVGEYWSSNLLTAMSADTVQVRTVVPLAGKLVPYVWAEDRRWCLHAPQFVIWQDANKTDVTFSDVRATYPICQMAFVAGYRIAVLAWHDREPTSNC